MHTPGSPTPTTPAPLGASGRIAAAFQSNALTPLLALVACFFIGALLMEFFTFMGALMSRSGNPHTAPVLGAGTRALLGTIADPRSFTAPALSLPALAAYSIAVGYAWLVVTWVLHLRGKTPAAARKKPVKAPRKASKT